jgi:hypothetical protein
MSNDPLGKARTLIQQKKYAEARMVLRRINTSKAKDWLAKLDEIAPAEKKPRGGLSPVLTHSIMLLLGLLIGGVIGAVAGSTSARSSQTVVAAPPQAVTNIVTVTPTQVEPSAMPEQATDIAVGSESDMLTPVAGKWIAISTVSSFDDTTTFGLALDAENSVRGWLSSEIPTLYLRCRSRQLDVYITLGMTAEVAYDEDWHTARLRFDSDAAQTLLMGVGAEDDTLFFEDPEAIIISMLNHDTLLFGFTPFNATPVETRFDLRELSQAIHIIRDPCPA